MSGHRINIKGKYHPYQHEAAAPRTEMWSLRRSGFGRPKPEKGSLNRFKKLGQVRNANAIAGSNEVDQSPSFYTHSQLMRNDHFHSKSVLPPGQNPKSMSYGKSAHEVQTNPKNKFVHHENPNLLDVGETGLVPDPTTEQQPLDPVEQQGKHMKIHGSLPKGEPINLLFFNEGNQNKSRWDYTSPTEAMSASNAGLYHTSTHNSLWYHKRANSANPRAS